ncbi:MAG: (2Fe-2S)-binding protein [Planctomycetaceae bacterium]|nr:(2Fe-2S)-binding protein [Planctomycetaceae bacterium]
MQLDDTICYCFHVTKRKIVNYIRVYRPRRASQISDCGGAGTGCGWCIPYLKRYFEEAQRAQPSVDDALSASEYAKQRAQYIREGKGTPAAGAIPLPNDGAGQAPA